MRDGSTPRAQGPQLMQAHNLRSQLYPTRGDGSGPYTVKGPTGRARPLNSTARDIARRREGAGLGAPQNERATAHRCWRVPPGL